MATDLRRGTVALEASSFERFYRLHRAEVLRFVQRDVANRADAEEITQNAFLEAYRALQRGHEPEMPRAWLYGIAKNAARRRFRTQSRRPREVELVPEVAETLAEEPIGDADSVRDAVASLRPNYREIVFLREVEGLSYAEIARRMDLSQSAVETLLFRARRVLRERLEAEGIRPAVRRGLGRVRAGILAPVGLWRQWGRADLFGAGAATKAAAGAVVVVLGAGVVAGTDALSSRAAAKPPATRSSSAAARVSTAAPAVPAHTRAVSVSRSGASEDTRTARGKHRGRKHHAVQAPTAGAGAGAALPLSGSGATASAGDTGSTGTGSGGDPITAPVLDLPPVSVPDVPLPDVSVPPVSVPSVPGVDLPTDGVETPSVSVPEVSVPQVSDTGLPGLGG